MKASIILKQKQVDYTLRISKKAGHMRLTVHPDGELVVTIPERSGFFGGISQDKVERFIKDKGEWILDTIENFKKKWKGPPPDKLIRNTKANYLKYKEVTRELVKQRIEYWNRFYKFKYNRIAIKNQSSRWGSCSKKGNLNFNYRLALIPQDLSDYVIVHELCHLKEFNHSRKFWDLVARTLPDFKERRDRIKTQYYL